MGVLSQQKPTVILVGVDLADKNSLALKSALSHADKLVRAHVHAVHAFKTFGPVVFTDVPGMPIEGLSYKQASARLRSHVFGIRAEMEKDLKHPICEELSVHLSDEHPSELLSRKARDLEADLIIVGTHEHKGISRIWHGLTSEEIMRHAPCSVMVVRAPDRGPEMPEFAHACPKCIEMRQKTQGKNLWCSQHSEHHGPRHTYRFVSRPLG